MIGLLNKALSSARNALYGSVRLCKMEEAVPRRADTDDFLQLTRAAREALEASDQGRLTEEQ